MKKFIGLIPTRIGSSRLPAKPLLEIGGIPLIIHTYKRSKLSKKLDDVIICCDDKKILKVAKKYKAKCVMTSKHHNNGTERITEVALKLNRKYDYIVDIQGDEPLISPDHIDKVVEFHKKNGDFDIILPTLKIKLADNQNLIKVVSDKKDNVLYLSRSKIPLEFKSKTPYFKKHLSIISFKKESLIKYSSSKKTQLEKIEDIELLRALEIGLKIKTIDLKGDSFSIDVKEDFIRAKEKFKSDKIIKKYTWLMKYSNKIVYKINNIKHDIIYTNNILSSISKKIKEFKSDKKIYFIYDENINKAIINNIFLGLKLTGCKIYQKKIKSLKKNKNLKNLTNLINSFSNLSLTKKSIVLVCGGGVIGDLAGLASSLYKRGLIYINIPSTMTAMVDSCIGGKTGVNHLNQINLIGTYFHPRSVFIYDEIIKSIPEREYISGLAEVVKSSILSKKFNIKFLENNTKKIIQKNKFLVKKIILNSLNTKLNHFLYDIYEDNNRLFLNFGHTFAHAYEMATDELFKKDFLRHGEAVSLGIISEIALSFLETKNKQKRKKIFLLLLKITKILSNLNLPTKLNLPETKNQYYILKKIYYYVFKDKKKISEKPRYIYLNNLGEVTTKEIENFDNINKVIYYISNDIDLREIWSQ